MVEPHPLDLKEDGNKAYKAGNFKAAIELYTQAIALDATSAPVYHNRAVAHVQLGSLEAALRDAQLAIDNDRSYAKAYSTKGSVLARMGRKAEAIAAYKAGLEVAPGNSSLLERLREAERPAPAPAAVPPRPAAPSSTASAAGRGSGAPAASPGVRHFAFLTPVVEAARVFLLIAFLASVLLPLALGEGVGARLHALLLGTAAGLHAVQLFQAHGIPKFSAEWFGPVLEDPTLHLVFFPLVYIAYHPAMLVSVASCLWDWLFALDFLYKAAATRVPAAAAAMERAAALIVPYAVRRPAPEVAAMTTAAKWRAVNAVVPHVCAHLEIGILLMVVVELLTPDRSLLVLLLSYQLMSFHYAFSGPLREAWAGIDASVRSLTAHPRCPAAVATAYDSLSRFVRSLVKDRAELEEQARRQRDGGGAAAAGGAAAGGITGMLQKCSVM